MVGLIFLGFPLHPSGRSSVERAAHLNAKDIPMLFLRGTRDGLAEIGLLASVVERLKRANLSVVENGDHSFHVPARWGRTDQGVKGEMLDAMMA